MMASQRPVCCAIDDHQRNKWVISTAQNILLRSGQNICLSRNKYCEYIVGISVAPLKIATVSGLGEVVPMCFYAVQGLLRSWYTGVCHCIS